ncbi:DNA translocase [Mycobacterium phage WXIN]|nr:DNA translocase [Mycobacterium phage WXIN]
MTDYIARIESVFQQFKIDASVTTYTVGPSVTRYEVALGPGVKVEKVARLQKNLAYTCAAESVRVQAPIPGKSAVGIELPNPRRRTVALGDIAPGGHPLSVPIGVDIEGRSVTARIDKMPHLLVAGTTGSGKSSFINSMLVSLLGADPDKVKLVLIDPKCVELTPYDGVAHLLRPVVTETVEAVGALQSLVDEMESRYEAMRAAKVRSIDGLGLPYIVVVIDELADLMMQAKEAVEGSTVRLLQKARAAGIHLVLATQRPSVDVVTGLLKANLPTRLAFATASLTDSRVVLDEGGAEQLLGMGDGLFKPVGSRSAVRIQGAYVSDAEIAGAVQQATATAAVEDMVEQLHPHVEEGGVTVLDYLNGLIEECNAAGQRAGGFVEKLNKKPGLWGRKSNTLEMFSQTPAELGIAADSLVKIAREIAVLRDAAMSGNL